MISVIISTRNRSSMIAAAVSALDVAADGHVVEVLLVDNGSVDDTQRVIESLNPSNITLVCLSEPIAGVCRAKNLGVRKAKGDILVFSDDDCRVEPDYFNHLVAHYAQDSKPVIRGGRVELGDPTDAAITIKIDDHPGILGGFEHPGGFIHGCNLTMSRAVLDQIGPWDERFGPGAEFLAAEETELNYRALKAGFQIHYVPDMVTRHYHGRKKPEDIRKLNWQYQCGNGALYGKHADVLLTKHLYWYFRNWIREMFGGHLFSDELQISHREVVLAQLFGATKYWFRALTRR